MGGCRLKATFIRCVAWCLFLALLSGGRVSAETDAREAYGSVSITKVEALPEWGWQKTAVFPDWKGYTDDTLALNSTISFRSYRGQGTIWLQIADGVERFSLYVNGVKCDTSGVTGGVWSADISGETVDGVNTLQVSNIMPLGLEKAVEVHIPYPVVTEGEGSLEGIDPLALQLISDIIDSDIDHGFTSAQLAVVRHGRMVADRAWGLVNAYLPDGTPRQDSAPATVETLYDLASVTKMFSINYAVQKLVTDGALDIDSTIADILGEQFADETLDFAYAGEEVQPDHETQIAWKRELTIRDVLRHQAGFPASPRYNDPDFDMSLLAVGEPGSNLCHAADREETLAAICRTPLIYEPGARTVYSDVDYMLLTFVVEAVTGRRLDDYMKETFYEPMGLAHTTFLPLENGFEADDCAATELNGNTRDEHISFEGIRTATVQGEVHDERAWYCMQGVSGHAGLFSNAADLAKLASVMLTGGYGEHRFFSRNVMDGFTAPKAFDFGQWGLGWWREGDDQRVWYFGTQAAPNTVGHQGWTGTLVMIDPSRDLVIAYLTNKINSPITDEADLNSFSGSCYTASTLGFVPQILSIGMDSDTDISGQLLDLVADMAAESLKLIPEGAGADHPYVKNAQSKLDVLRKWAGDDAAYRAVADELSVEAILSRMTLKDKLAQMMIPSFRVWKEVSESEAGTTTVENAEDIPATNITELNDEIRACLAQYRFGGMLLFAENCRDAEQTLRLVADMQTANQRGGGLPMLFCIDQEGGNVARLSFGTTGAGNMALAATADPENAAAMAAIYGEELRLLGIHADYAPVMDVNNEPNNPVIGVRAFSDRPEVTAAFGKAFIEGLHSAGTMATLKHFPGHGNTDTDSHTGFPRIDASYDELKAFELIPFRAAIDAGADMIMTAHIQYPKIETETYTSISTGEEVSLPATMSRVILTDILRGDMGFEGVIVSDALDMAAISDNFAEEDIVRLTINAGADMLILPCIYDTALYRKALRMVDTAVRLAEAGEIDASRVDDSVRRILTLKQKYGLLDQTDFTVTDTQVRAAVEGVGSEGHRGTAWSIAQTALTLVKNENDVFPVRMQPGEDALILFADSCASRVGSGELFMQMLEAQGALPEGARITVMSNTADNGDACLEAALHADHVILVHRIYNSSCMDPDTEDGFSSGVFDRIIEARHAERRPAILISCQLPYDAARFVDADAILLTYGSSPMRQIPPDHGEGSAYAPNLPAALCACFGMGKAGGMLPVDIPALDEGYGFAKEILYGSGMGVPQA